MDNSVELLDGVQKFLETLPTKLAIEKAQKLMNEYIKEQTNG